MRNAITPEFDPDADARSRRPKNRNTLIQLGIPMDPSFAQGALALAFHAPARAQNTRDNFP